MDAALLMTRHGLRHVPVVSEGRVTGLLSERDLFGLQSQSIHHVSAAIRSAEALPALQQAATAVRQFTQHLLAQGLQAGTLTGLISHLNDLLTRRIVTLEAGRAGMTLDDACWLALGSEGREEQTIATDQDNAWVVRQFEGTSTRQQWLTIAGRVNAVLDACGFPLCRGGIMASKEKGLLLFVYTSALMFVLRFFAGPIVHRISPIGLLFVSACFGAIGLISQKRHTPSVA
jgi:CBS domain-containing protein